MFEIKANENCKSKSKVIMVKTVKIKFQMLKDDSISRPMES